MKETLGLAVRGKAKKYGRRYVVKFSEKNRFSYKVPKNGISENKRIEINTGATEYSYKW